MLLIRSLIYEFLLYFLLAVMGLAFAPFAIYSRDGAYLAIKTYARVVLWLLEKICGLRCEVRGPVPTGDILIASKHQSFLDILIHTRALDRPKFIMKQELRWTPVLGLYAMRIGSTPVARGKKGKAVSEMVSGVKKGASDPGQLVIYPQGTRVAPGVSLPFKIGAGVLYQRSRKPCIPAATNAGVFWARKGVLKRPGVAVIEYLPEIPAGLPLKDFMTRMETQIETASDALMAEAGFHAPAPVES